MIVSRLFRKTDAVVGDGQDGLIVFLIEADVDMPSLAMTDCVGNRLLRDTV